MKKVTVPTINLVSVVVPVFNEEATLVQLHKLLCEVLNKYGCSYELIFVDDGSSDGSSSILRSLHPIRVFSHAANRGQVAALDTGVVHAGGDVIVFVDADMQNDPKEIPMLLDKIAEGYGAVIGHRQGRKERWTRMLFSHIANAAAAWLFKIHIHDFGCGLAAYRTVHIRDFRHFGETKVFLPAIAKMRGASVTEVPVTFNQRAAGYSKVRISFMVRGSLDMLSVAFFVKYSMNPFRFFGAWAVLFVLLGVGSGTKLGSKGHAPEATLAATLCLIAAVLSVMFGLAVEMILRVYYGSGSRPLHPLKESFENKA